MKAIIRVDASPTIGGGHVMRCLTLADELAQRNWRCFFAVRPGSMQTVPKLNRCRHEVIELARPKSDEIQEIKTRLGCCDWLIVDHYNREKYFESTARSFADKIMVIDDLADRVHDCDILLDQTYGRDAKDYKELVPEHSRLLIGTDYALLRPEFARQRTKALERRKKNAPVYRIFVSLGASDPRGITTTVLQAIKKSSLDVGIDIVIGTDDPETMGLTKITQTMSQQVNFHGFNADIAELMVNADLAIGAGGSTSWERCCLGLPTLMIVTADNQEKIAQILEHRQIAHIIGRSDEIELAQLTTAITLFFKDQKARNEMSWAGSNICDGLGAIRVAQEMGPPLRDKAGAIICLRMVLEKDGEWLLALQSHPQTRRFFRNPEQPDSDAHFPWLVRKLADPSVLFMMIIRDNQRAGYIRLDYREAKEAYEISLAVDPNCHSMGVGKVALKLLHELVPDAVLIAKVAPENMASSALFLADGFTRQAGDWFISRP